MSQEAPHTLPFRRDVERRPTNHLRRAAGSDFPARANPNRPAADLDWQRFGRWAVDGSPVSIDFDVHDGRPPKGADARYHAASGRWVSIRLVVG